MDHLSKAEESLLENTGTAGLVLTLACLVQILFYMLPHWINYLIIVLYIFVLVSYILLIKKKSISFLLLLIGTILIFVLEALALRFSIYSTLLLILSVYCVVAVVLLYMSDALKKLKMKNLDDRMEKDKWEDIL